MHKILLLLSSRYQLKGDKKVVIKYAFAASGAYAVLADSAKRPLTRAALAGLQTMGT